MTKDELLRQIKSEHRKNDDVFTSFFVTADCIDANVCREAQNIFCSFDIPLEPSFKGDKLLFDKKMFASKSNLLNNSGLVFGFCLYYAKDKGDTLKLFLDRFDFALNQYPNHVNFPQMESEFPSDLQFGSEPQVTGVFSANDIRHARNIAFAARTFYSCGRAVPWFLSILRPLRITPSAFFADFAEWQRCNNCDYKSGFNPEQENHIDIEKMQLLFLNQKYEEKGKSQMLSLVHDIVKINGAMSRLCGDDESDSNNAESKNKDFPKNKNLPQNDGRDGGFGKKSSSNRKGGEKSKNLLDEIILKTSYNPNDLLSEEVLDVEKFYENVCMENCTVRLFATDDGIDFEIV